jgi:hypothetical protein
MGTSYWRKYGVSMAFLAFTAVTVLDCGGGGSSDGQFRNERVQLFCSKAHECQEVFVQQKIEEGSTTAEAEAWFELQFGSGVADCVEKAASQIDQQYEEALEAALEQETVEYSAEKGKQCLDALADVSCAVFVTEEISICDDSEIYSGTRENGESCSIDLECAGPGAWCAVDSNTCTSN